MAAYPAYPGGVGVGMLPRWMPSTGGAIPPGAVYAGYDGGDQLFIGRAYHQGDLIPGKVQPSHRCCYVAYAGGEHICRQYEVLVNQSGCQLEWRQTSGPNLPDGAVQAGRTAQGEPLYIGRHNYNGSLTVGKVHPSHGCLYIPYGGEEHRLHDYEVLVCRSVQF